MMRFRSAVFHLAVWLVLGTSTCFASPECNITVETLIEAAFLLNVGQQLRGADDNILLPFFRDSVSSLINVIKLKQSTFKNGIGKICIEDNEFELLGFSNDVSKAQNFTIPKGLEWVSDLHNNTPTNAYKVMGISSAVNIIESMEDDSRFTGQVFYLPSSEISEQQIPELSKQTSSKLYTIWDDTKKYLESDPTEDLMDKITQLPLTIDIFFDPLQDKVKERFSRQKLIGEEISAERLLYRVATMVLRLHKAGSPNEEALKMLRHATAFIFNGMRSDRKEGDELMVSTLFLPLYESAFHRLIHNFNLAEVPEISEESVEIVYKDVLAPLLKFSSHGLLEHETWQDGSVEQVNFTNLLFDDIKLNFVGMDYTNQTTMAETVRARFNPEVIKYVTRNSGNCDPASSFNYDYTIGETTMCCAFFCGDADALLTLGDVTAQDCCEACNSEACDSNSAGSMSECLEIVLREYGLFNETTVIIV